MVKEGADCKGDFVFLSSQTLAAFYRLLNTAGADRQKRNQALFKLHWNGYKRLSNCQQQRIACVTGCSPAFQAWLSHTSRGRHLQPSAGSRPSGWPSGATPRARQAHRPVGHRQHTIFSQQLARCVSFFSQHLVVTEWVPSTWSPKAAPGSLCSQPSPSSPPPDAAPGPVGMPGSTKNTHRRLR